MGGAGGKKMGVEQFPIGHWASTGGQVAYFKINLTLKKFFLVEHIQQELRHSVFECVLWEAKPHSLTESIFQP